jgi:AsmA protein
MLSAMRVKSPFSQSALLGFMKTALSAIDCTPIDNSTSAFSFSLQVNFAPSSGSESRSGQKCLAHALRFGCISLTKRNPTEGPVRLIFSLLTAIIIVVAAIFFVGPLFISADDVRNQLFAQIESATGYRLRMSGPVDVTLFPSFHLVAEDVGIAQPAVRGDTEFATAKKLKFGLMLKGLLDGKMQMTEVTLIDPVIVVPSAPTKPVAGEQAGGAEGDQPGGGSAPEVAEQLSSLSLDKLVIDNGTVILPPSGQMPGKRIEKLNLAASLPAFDAALEFDAAAIVDGKAIEAAGSIGNFGRFLEGSPAPVSLQGTAPSYLEGKATLSGTATYKDNAFALGQFSAKAGDQTLTGTALYKAETFTLSQFTATSGPYSLAGNASYSNNKVTINPMRASVRGTAFTGWITADLSNQVPYVVASLAAKTVDINALTGAAKSKPAGGGGVTNAGSDPGGGPSGGSGWSNAPIDFSSLKTMNGKFGLSAEEIIYEDIKIRPVRVHATLSAGKLDATLADFNLYGGAAKAALAIDASGKTPAHRVKVSFVEFDAYPFLRDAANFQSIEGKGTIALDLNATGASQSAIVSALGGNAKLEFFDGAIRGINIAKMLRNLSSGIVEGWQGGEGEKTDFASLGGSFKVAQGKATTDDLHLVGPLVRMTGAGAVDLPVKQLNFRVEPRLVASLEGQGGKQDLAGLGVPLMISGPWGKPKIYPDIKGILENPTAAYERLRQLGDGVVKLPGIDKLDKTGTLPRVIQDGKVNKDAVIEGLSGLLNKNQPAAVQATAPAPQAMSTAPEVQPEAEATSGSDDSMAAAKKAKKDKKKMDAEDVGRQILESFLGGQ